MKIPNKLKNNLKSFKINEEDFMLALNQLLQEARKELNNVGMAKYKDVLSEMAVKNPRKFIAWAGAKSFILYENYEGFNKLRKRLNKNVNNSGKLAEWLGKKYFGKSLVKEAWGKETKVSKAKKGMFKGWTLAKLRSERAKLKNKKDHTKEESKKLREINFAIRAKTGWGKVSK